MKPTTQAAIKSRTISERADDISHRGEGLSAIRRAGLIAIALLIAWGLVSASSRAETGDGATLAYQTWAKSLTLQGSNSSAAKQAWAEYREQLAAEKNALAKVQSPKSKSEKQRIVALTKQIECELAPGLPTNRFRNAAIKLALEGRWSQAADEIASIPDENHVPFDFLISGYGALAEMQWLKSWQSFQQVSSTNLLGSLLQACREIDANNPENPHVRFLLADSYMRVGRPDLALSISTPLIKTNWDESLAFYIQAVALLRTGKGDLIKTDMAPFLSRSSNDLMATWLVVWELVITDNCDDAEKRLTALIVRDPTFFPAYHLRGLALARRNRFDEALEDIDVALRLAPDYLPAKSAQLAVLSRKSDNALAALADSQTNGLAPKGTLEVQIRNASDFTYATQDQQDRFLKTASPQNLIDMRQKLVSADNWNRFWENVTTKAGISFGEGIKAGVDIGHNPSASMAHRSVQSDGIDRIDRRLNDQSFSPSSMAQRLVHGDGIANAQSFEPKGGVASSDAAADRTTSAFDPNLTTYNPDQVLDFFFVSPQLPH